MINIDMLKNRQTQFVILAVAILAIFSLWIRLLPMFTMGNTDILSMVASDDPLYNLRQTEQILSNFPNYAWYDPMTFFPVGSHIYWGSLFPTIVAIACLVTGAVTRPEIIATGLVIPPIMAMVMVPVMYYIGKTCGDWKTGLFSAFFITVVSGQYFFRSFYGYMDHHMAEVLFSSIFCMCYMYALYSAKDAKIVLTDIKSYKNLIFLSVLTGIAYIFGLIVMPTMILFAMIVVFFTAIQSVIDGLRERTSEYLVVINTAVFLTAIVGAFLYGFKAPGIGLDTYTIGHVYAYLLVIGITIALYVIPKYIGKGNYLISLAVMVGGVITFIVFLAVLVPSLYQLFVISLFSFFGQQAITNTVQEAMGWTAPQAWSAFNYGLILMIGGVLVMVYRNIKDEHPYYIFGLVWALIVFYSTWQHIRYEYYLAVPLSLLSAVCISYILDLGIPGLKKFSQKLAKTETPAQPIQKSTGKPKDKRARKLSRQTQSAPKTAYDQIISVLVILIIVISSLFAYLSVSQNYANAAATGFRMNPDWRETMDWLYNNTPDPGVNYTQIYDADTFQYPQQAYGVMSWWDYGHLITYIAKRIPNANPFQQGVVGMNGSANFFIAPSEAAGNQVLDTAGTRYVVTDIEMSTGKFWAMATWYNATLGGAPYQGVMLTPNQQDINGGYAQVQVNTEAYYSTMISRLHNFDGSLIDPQKVYYVEYVDPAASGVSLPVITSAMPVNASEIRQKISDYNQHAIPGHHATVLSPIIVEPTGKFPALQHYRLVHESPNNVFTNNLADVKYVKTFEYVKGAHIKGEGLIGINLVTNTGRNFTYLQESVNGEFIVPYSTIGNPYGVKSISKYHVFGTGAEYDVPEFAVTMGLSI
jgi:dolichyl-diphosphooligosaccharide--protein glycosyltransferase